MEGLCIRVQTKHDVEVMKWVLFLRYSFGLRPVEERGWGGGGGVEIFPYFEDHLHSHNK